MYIDLYRYLQFSLEKDTEQHTHYPNACFIKVSSFWNFVEPIRQFR